MAFSVQARQAVITDGFAFKIGVAGGSDFSTKLGRALVITDGYLYKEFSGLIAVISSIPSIPWIPTMPTILNFFRRLI